MPASNFARRTSNAASSSHVASSSSSAAPIVPSNQPQPMMPAMTSTSNNVYANSSTVAGSPAYAAAVASGGNHMSEFGSGGGVGMAGGSMGRAPEGSSRTTSPSLSPTLGGAQGGTFPSGSLNANQSISQSIQASNVDVQSIHSATNSTFTASNTSTFASSSGQHTDMSLRETFSRRIRGLAYIKRCLSIVSQPSTFHPTTPSNSPAWLDVIKLSRRDLEIIYDSDKMKRRTNRNHTLGCSIAPTLEYSSSAEFARALLAIFNEVEIIGDGGEKDRAKMRNFFKSSVRGTRRGMTGMDWEGSMVNGGAAVGGIDLLGSQVPFSLDFFQTTITLCDILVEMYHKFTFFMVNAKEVGTWNSSMAKDDVGTEIHYASVTASTLETMHKIDGKVKKMMSQICKELDALARHVIREELASIDPLMARELGLLDGTGGHFGVEGSNQPGND